MPQECKVGDMLGTGGANIVQRQEKVVGRSEPEPITLIKLGSDLHEYEKS